jgi:cobalt-zinc-cadmium efflux system protein
MSHHHDHAHDSLTVSRKLIVATIANVLVVAGEVIAGFTTGSLALIGDALHNLTDVAALVIALVAVHLARRAPTQMKSFGYQRAGILAAFINAGFLVAFSLFIFMEAWERLAHPHDVQTGPALLVASVALVVNLATAISIRHESRHDVNIRGAFLHMLGDVVSSAGIIVAVILIRVTGSTRWDALVSIGICILILVSSYEVLRESVNLLLEGTPSGIDPAAVIESLRSVKGIHGVHHLHIWALGPSSPALSCHLMVGDVPLRNTSSMLDDVKAMLEREYRIAHTTIQFELAECDANDPFCVRF